MSKVDWVANVRANPEAVIWVRRRRIRVVAHEYTDDELQKIRTEAFERWPGAERYERESGRPTPFFRFEPMSSGSS